ncbi:MAG: hypothetical protein ABJN14_02720 [Paracoccaceae bacterium]
MSLLQLSNVETTLAGRSDPLWDLLPMLPESVLLDFIHALEEQKMALADSDQPLCRSCSIFLKNELSAELEYLTITMDRIQQEVSDRRG